MVVIDGHAPKHAISRGLAPDIYEATDLLQHDKGRVPYLGSAHTQYSAGLEKNLRIYPELTEWD